MTLQGWGNAKGKLRVALLRNGEVVALHDLWGIVGRDIHQTQPPLLTLMTEDVVGLAQPGDVLRMEYRVGHGGGHCLEVINWTCPSTLSAMRVSIALKHLFVLLSSS